MQRKYWIESLLFSSVFVSCNVEVPENDFSDIENLGTTFDAIASSDDKNANETATLFSADPTPVDLRNYYPVSYHWTTWRRQNGFLYMRQLVKPNDPMAYWVHKSYAGQMRVEYSIEDWIGPYGSETTYYRDSWSMRHASNQAVIEIGDSFAADYSNSRCTDWCNGSGQYYSKYGIVHGCPGGHTLGERGCGTVGNQVYWTGDRKTTAPKLIAHTLWSGTKMFGKYDSFTPDYGRQADGSWGTPSSKLYTKVVGMAFEHGVSPNKECANKPPNFYHQPGYTSYLIYEFKAPDVGIIQMSIEFDETTCEGRLAPAPEKVPGDYVYYIDE